MPARQSSGRRHDEAVRKTVEAGLRDAGLVEVEAMVYEEGLTIVTTNYLGRGGRDQDPHHRGPAALMSDDGPGR